MKYLNITELKKLPPEKRIVELKKILRLEEKEEELDKEKIRALQEMIAEAEEEMHALEKLVVGEAKKIGKEEKKEEEKEELSLEERAVVKKREDEARIQLTKQEKDAAYSLSQKPVADLYNKLSDIYKTIKTGEAGEQDREYAQILRVALYKKEKDVEAGRYAPDEDAVSKMNQAERIIHYLKDEIQQEKQYKS